MLNAHGKNTGMVRIFSGHIRAFDVKLAPGETGENLLMHTKDHFTLGLAPLRLCFEPRKA